MFHPTPPSRRLWLPTDRALQLDVERGVRCSRCRKPKFDPARGLVRGCCCVTCGCPQICTPPECEPVSALVTASGISLCVDGCYGLGGGTNRWLEITSSDSSQANRTLRLCYIGEQPSTCQFKSRVFPFNGTIKEHSSLTGCDNASPTIITNPLIGYTLTLVKSGPSFIVVQVQGLGVFSKCFVPTSCVLEDLGTLSNGYTACKQSDSSSSNDCGAGQDTTNESYGEDGTVDIVSEYDASLVACSFCTSCSQANQVTCLNASCDYCTPGTIRLTTSSITVAFGCIDGTTAKWKLAGTTAANRTIDLLQDATDKCKWQEDVASDWVLTKATSYALSTITYRMTKTSATNWHAEVFASGGGQTVYFFDGNVTVGAADCTSAATANNSLACDLCATPKTAGNSGTFAKPGTAGGGTDCGNCTTLTTPASFSATIADVVACTDTCVCTSRYSLTGSTAINRSITLTQVGGSPCVFEGTITSADWILYDFDTAAATHNIDSLLYRLRRVAATTNGWAYDVVGLEGSTERLSIVGTDGASCTFAAITSNATANKCADTITAPTHVSRTACIVDSGVTGKVGSGGSSSFDVCP